MLAFRLENMCLLENNVLKKQNELNYQMIVILIDWMIEVSFHFELNMNTIHLAVMYLWKCLSVFPICKRDIQLFGISALKLAEQYIEQSKEHYRQETCKEYSYITADEYKT